MLTLAQLNVLPHAVFASGIGLIVHPEFNLVKRISEGGVLEEDGRHVMVKWVAKRGVINDWTIYHSLCSNLIEGAGQDYRTWREHILYPDDIVMDMGQKLYNHEDIKRLVPCDDEAFAMYRF